MAAARRGDRGGLVAGLIMIVVGAIFLLERFDYVAVGEVWRLWPMILIVLGLLNLVRPERGRRSIFLLLLGIWLQISFLELWGLDFGDSWPLLIVFVGASLVFDSVVGGTQRSRSALPGGARPTREGSDEI